MKKRKIKKMIQIKDGTIISLKLKPIISIDFSDKNSDTGIQKLTLFKL